LEESQGDDSEIGLDDRRVVDGIFRASAQGTIRIEHTGPAPWGERAVSPTQAVDL